jgi:oligopeptide transport system ATP-binding protein
VDNVNLEIKRGETLGLVGESGCGKSTLGRVILKLIEKTGGTIYYEDKDIYAVSKAEMIRLRRHMQIIFQDPFASLNPRLRVRSVVEEPLRFHGVKTGRILRVTGRRSARVGRVFPEVADRFPHSFREGAQRIGMPRLVLLPDFFGATRRFPRSYVSVQAQVLKLLQD